MSIATEYIKTDWVTSEKRAMRDGFGEGLLKVSNQDLVVLTADLGKSLRILNFRDKYPDRYFNVGVAEQNMIGVAAGLAMEGFVPVATSFGVFSPARNWDQIRVSVAITNTNVKIVGSHAGLSVGENGASHQALEDVAIMRVLPNMVVLSPSDYTQTISAVEAMIAYKGPVYMRFPRAESVCFTKKTAFEIGKAYRYREGSDLTLFVTGIFVWDALMVAEQMAREGLDIEVIAIPTIKPLDIETIVTSVKKTKKAITLEDHQVSGGMGSAVIELLASRKSVPVLRLGVKDVFGESGRYGELYKKHFLDQEGIENSISKFLAR